MKPKRNSVHGLIYDDNRDNLPACEVLCTFSVYCFTMLQSHYSQSLLLSSNMSAACFVFAQLYTLSRWLASSIGFVLEPKDLIWCTMQVIADVATPRFQINQIQPKRLRYISLQIQIAVNISSIWCWVAYRVLGGLIYSLTMNLRCQKKRRDAAWEHCLCV